MGPGGEPTPPRTSETAPGAELPTGTPAPDASAVTGLYVPGQMVGPYRIQAVLGEGGMGRVYRAEDTRLLRSVALKALTAHRVHGATPLREAQMAARLHHPHIATVHDVLDVDGTLLIVMECLEGRPLSRLLAEEPLPPAQVSRLFGEILQAVAHAHQSGVLHCDLKPANVFVQADGLVKVLDFGLARLATSPVPGESSMALAGTPRYLAPERLQGAHPSIRSDIYSLGVMLGDMLRREAADVASASAPTRPLPAAALARRTALEGLAARATAHDPDMRYRSVADMMRALDEATTPRGGVSDGRLSRLGYGVTATLAGAATLLVAMLSVPRATSGANPVLAIDLSAVGADPVSAHFSAALEPVLQHALTGAPAITVVKTGSGSSRDEAGATHRLDGAVERAGSDLRVALAVKAASGEVLASERVTTSLGDPGAAAAALISGTEVVLQRAGLPVGRRTLDGAMARVVLSIEPRALEDYAQAMDYLRSPEVPGALDHAIGVLGQAVGRAPSFAPAHAGLADAYWRKYQMTRDMRWTDRARASALDALRLNADDPAVRYTLALIYRGMGRHDDALSEISRAILLQPSNDDLYRLRGRLHADLGRVEQGLADLTTAIRLRPGYWDNHRVAGLILYNAGRYGEAVPHFQRETELRPGHASAFQTLGTAYHAANQLAEALAAYERALALAPSANTWSNIGLLHYAAGRYAEARRAYEASVKLQPREPVTRRNLGDTLRRLGLDARARAEYEAAIALADDQLAVNPSSLDALSLQALCHAKLGHRSDARRLAERVLAERTASPGMRYRAAVALVLIGHPDGPGRVADAIAAGYSRAIASTDDDLASVRTHPALAGVLR